MEKIKKALEQARAERRHGTSRSSKIEQRGQRTDRTPIDGPIEYSKTKVISPEPELLRSKRVIFDDQEREAATAYKMLRTQVLRRMVAQKWNALAITSPTSGDGKSLTAVNLAISLAHELHHSVLLVDLDLRKPSIHKVLGLNPEKGIGHFLLDGVPLDEILLNPGIERLVVLPGHGPLQNSSEILASPAMGDLVVELKTRYASRFVLFDLPPLLSADDALAFAPFVDAFLLVLRDAKTTRRDVQHVAEMLKDVSIIGTVLNASSDKISTYY